MRARADEPRNTLAQWLLDEYERLTCAAPSPLTSWRDDPREITAADEVRESMAVCQAKLTELREIEADLQAFLDDAGMSDQPDDEQWPHEMAIETLEEWRKCLDAPGPIDRDKLRCKGCLAVMCAESAISRYEGFLDSISDPRSRDPRADLVRAELDADECARIANSGAGGAAHFYQARLPAVRARKRCAEDAVAAGRRSCTGPCRRTRARARGAGRPRHRRASRAHAPPGDSEGEPHPRGYPRGNDVDLTARALA